jgi:hypothetical protein
MDFNAHEARISADVFCPEELETSFAVSLRKYGHFQRSVGITFIATFVFFFIVTNIATFSIIFVAAFTIVFCLNLHF